MTSGELARVVGILLAIAFWVWIIHGIATHKRSGKRFWSLGKDKEPKPPPPQPSKDTEKGSTGEARNDVV